MCTQVALSYGPKCQTRLPKSRFIKVARDLVTREWFCDRFCFPELYREQYFSPHILQLRKTTLEKLTTPNVIMI